MKRTTTALLLGILALPLYGTTYYVAATGGNDGDNGLTEATAFEHIRRAADLVQPGDTVYVRAGTYRETPSGSGGRADGIRPARSGLPGSPITFVNYPGETPVIDAEYNGSGFIMRDHVILDGFKVMRGWEWVYASVSVNYVNDCVVQNCHVTNNRGTDAGTHSAGFYIQGAMGVDGYRHTIRNCKIEDMRVVNGSDNINSTCIMLYHVNFLTVENCDLSRAYCGTFNKHSGRTNHYRRNFYHGLDYIGWSGNNNPNADPAYEHHLYENIFHDNGRVAAQGQTTLTNGFFYNNTVYRSGGFTALAGGSSPNRRFHYWNNLVVDSHNTGGIDGRRGYFMTFGQGIAADAVSYIDYNCVYPTFRTVIGVYEGDTTYTSLSAWRAAYPAFDQHSFVADPEFVSGSPSAPADFHLQSGSPCENAGIACWNDETVDRNMGAYPHGNTTVVGLLPADVPTIGITTPTGAGTYTTQSATVDIAGGASDNVAVTQVTWENDRGGAGTATGTAAWSIAGIALQLGANVITVTAHDAEANTAAAILTVTREEPPPVDPPVTNDDPEPVDPPVTDVTGANEPPVDDDDDRIVTSLSVEPNVLTAGGDILGSIVGPVSLAPE